jgi:hypothetical protein
MENAGTSAHAQAARTSYDRAQQYDPQFEADLVDAIGKAITNASMITDCNVLAIRTGETIAALTTVLASMIALSPALRQLMASRKVIDQIAKDLRRQIAAARIDPNIESFVRGVFNSIHTEGCA